MKTMYRRLLLTLLATVAIISAYARYNGVAPVAGGNYYLLNVYQSKFLTSGNTLITDKQGTPTLYTATSGTSIAVNGTAYTIEKSTYGYMLKNGGNTLMFDAGVSCKDAAANTPTTIDCAQWMFVSLDEYTTMQAKPSFTMACLNVDGMPSSIKVYGVYNVDLNPDAKEGPGATAIGTKLKTSGWDVVGLSEDFNFHSELWNAAWNGGVDNENGYCYNATANGEKLNGSKAGILSNYNNKKTLFDTDGLCLFHRVSRLNVSGDDLKALETRVSWNDHNGYTDSGADGLIKKGFRHIVVSLNNGTPSDTSDDIELDVYILHMDAETNPGDNAARESQMKQLADYILATNNGRPIVIMGDTNCRYTRDPLKKKFIDVINADERFTCKDVWIEMCRDGYYPALGGGAIMVDKEGYRRGEVVDKMFYINNTASNYRIQPEQFRQDISFINEAGEPLADHWPMVTEFSYHIYDPAIDDVAQDAPEEAIEGVYLRNHATGLFLKAGGWWNTHAVQGTYGLPLTITPVSGGKYTLTNPTMGGGVSCPDPYMDNTSPEYTLMQRNGYYIFAYNGSAVSANDPTYWPGEYGPNKRYVTAAALNVADTYQQWEVLTQDDLLNEARYATPDNPYNVTFLLPGANFDRNDKYVSTNWTYRENNKNRMSHTLQTSDPNNAFGNFVGKVTVNSAKSGYSTKWSVEQTVSNLRAGTYKVTCQAFYEIDGGSSVTNGNAYFTVSGNTSEAMWNKHDASALNGNTAPTSDDAVRDVFNNGCYVNTRTVTVGDNGTITIKVGLDSDLGKSRKYECYFDNFQLFYLGDGNAYNVIHEDAVALSGEGSRAIASVLDEYPYATVAAAKADGKDDTYINTATEVLKNAVAMCNNADDATNLLTNADFSQGGEGTPVRPKGWNFACNPQDGVTPGTDFNVTGGVFNMWTTSIVWSELNQELRNLPNGTYKVSADFKTWKSEYLKGDGSNADDGYSWIGFFGAPADGTVCRADNIVGSVTSEGWTDGEFTNYSFYVNVPNHRLTIGVRNDVTRFYQIKNVKVEMVNAETFQKEVAKGCIYQDMCWMAHNALEYDLTAAKYAAAEDVDVRTGGFVQQPNALIRANAGTVAGHNVIVGGVCDNLLLTDKAPFQNSTEFTATNATYTRTMGNQWGTVMLPYDVKSDDEIQYYTLAKVNAEAEDGTMTFVEAEKLPAGTPGVFVKLGAEAPSVSLAGSNVPVVAGTGETLATGVDGWSLVGTYSQLALDVTEADDELYYISANKFWHATGALSVAPFRAYFTAPKSTNAVRSFRLLIGGDDEADAITIAPVGVSGEHEVYTLSGVRVPSDTALKPGLYIIDNKKTVVK